MKQILTIGFLVIALLSAVTIPAFATPSTTGTTTGQAGSRSNLINQMQATQQLTTKQLTPQEQIIGDERHTIRWSAPAYVPGSGLNILIVQCAPGEFAVSNMYILQSPELYITETYPVALPDTSMIWLAVVQNHNANKLLASIGAVCVSDAGTQVGTVIQDPSYSRTVNNIVNQFANVQNFQVTNLQQILNVYNTINQVAVQIAINNTGNVTQIINQTAGQIVKNNGTNIPEIVSNSTGIPPEILSRPPNTNLTRAPGGAPITGPEGPFTVKNQTDIAVPGSQFSGASQAGGEEEEAGSTNATRTLVGPPPSEENNNEEEQPGVRNVEPGDENQPDTGSTEETSTDEEATSEEDGGGNDETNDGGDTTSDEESTTDTGGEDTDQDASENTDGGDDESNNDGSDTGEGTTFAEQQQQG